METLIAKLENQSDITLRKNAPMCEYTSFQIGGPADLLVQPETMQALANCCRIFKEEGIRPQIIGSGSNLLVSDRGIHGVVLRLSNPFNKV